MSSHDANPLTLRKPERLRHRTLVATLFEQGSAIYAFPLRLQFRAIDADTLGAAFRRGRPDDIAPLQMMVTIPKRKQRRAVDRVLLRRRVREAYRLNRLHLKNVVESSADGGTLSLSFIYISDKICDYATIEKSMRRLLGKVEEAYTATLSPAADD